MKTLAKNIQCVSNKRLVIIDLSKKNNPPCALIDFNFQTMRQTNSFFNYKSAMSDNEFLKKKLSVTTYSSMSLLQMHELGIKVNQGQPWNRQEQRNCINSVVADTIREVSTKFNDITEKISIKKSRMYDDELLVMLLFYQTNKRGGTQDSWDTMYKKETGDLSNFKKRVEAWS